MFIKIALTNTMHFWLYRMVWWQRCPTCRLGSSAFWSVTYPICVSGKESWQRRCPGRFAIQLVIGYRQPRWSGWVTWGRTSRNWPWVSSLSPCPATPLPSAAIILITWTSVRTSLARLWDLQIPLRLPAASSHRWSPEWSLRIRFVTL